MCCDIWSDCSSDMPCIPSIVLPSNLPRVPKYALTSFLTSVLSSETYFRANLLAFYLAFILAIFSSKLSGISSAIQSGISIGILSVILISSDILSGNICDMSFGISSDIMFGISSCMFNGVPVHACPDCAGTRCDMRTWQDPFVQETRRRRKE